MWEHIIGHTEQKKFLQNYLQAKERPHALLSAVLPAWASARWLWNLLRHCCAFSITEQMAVRPAGL